MSNYELYDDRAMYDVDDAMMICVAEDLEEAKFDALNLGYPCVCMLDDKIVFYTAFKRNGELEFKKPKQP